MQLWPRRSEPEPVYYPETEYLGPIDESEWKDLLPELTRAYETSKPLFRALQIMMRREERSMARGPNKPITEASLLEWQEEQKQSCYRADLLRNIVRLPLHAAKQLKSVEERERARNSNQERDRKA